MADTASARLIATTLNRFIGMIHAARCIAQIWIPHADAEKSMYKLASKYGLQMTFGTTMLTLRKFEDLANTGQLQEHIPDGAEARNAIDWIMRECREHDTRTAANLLFAHYVPSNGEILALIERGGWGYGRSVRAVVGANHRQS